MAEQNDIQVLLYGTYDISIYHKIREKKEKQINDFVKSKESAPRQRSDEWFLMRNSVIGASELAVLVGMSPYQNFESLARKKKKQKQLVIFEPIMLVGDDIRRCSS